MAVEEAYFATSHARNGVLFQLSCMTVKDMVGDGSGTSGRLCGCLQFTDPITSAEEADYFVEKLLFILKNI